MRSSSRASAPGPVGHLGQQRDAPPRLGLVAAGDRRQQAGVDVAAAEHDDGRAARRGRDLAAQQGGHADGAGALDDELGLLHQQHHRLGHVVLLDQLDRVEHVAHERQRELAGPLDGDAVGDRHVGRLQAHRVAGGQRRAGGRVAGHLHADELDLRPGRLDRQRRRPRPARRRRRARSRARGRARPPAARGRACPARRSRRGPRRGARTPRRAPAPGPARSPGSRRRRRPRGSRARPAPRWPRPWSPARRPASPPRRARPAPAPRPPPPARGCPRWRTPRRPGRRRPARPACSAPRGS